MSEGEKQTYLELIDEVEPFEVLQNLSNKKDLNF